MKTLLKTYLFPKHMRMGMPCIQYVTKETSPDKPESLSYWLGIGHGEVNFNQRVNGTCRAYGNSSKVLVSLEFYEAFIAESRLNHKQYAKKEGWSPMIPTEIKDC